MSALSTFRQQLRSGQHLFRQTLAFIAEHYQYSPSSFSNGSVENAAGQNEGSCKTLGLAQLEGFSDEEALLAFDGTLFIVTHDRALLDALAPSVVWRFSRSEQVGSVRPDA